MIAREGKQKYPFAHPMHKAGTHARLDLVKKYLENDKSIVQDENWMEGTPLQTTIMKADKTNLCYEICEHLLNNGADVNKSDGYGRTALHIIARLEFDAKKVLDLLITRGADIHKKDNELYTPLFVAVAHKNLVISKKLLELGANPNEVSKKNETMMELAFSNKDEEMARLLLSYNANVNDLNAMCVSLKMDQVRLMRLLVKCGAEFDKEDWSDPSFRSKFKDCFTIAIRNQHLNVVDCLLETSAKTYDFFLENEPEYTFILYKHELNVRNMRKLPSRKVDNTLITKNIAIRNEINETPLLESPLRFIEDEPESEYKKQYTKYVDQLILMKKMKVCKDMQFTYFDLLTRRGKSLLECCNEETASALLSNQYERLFPDFTQKLERNVDRGMLERKIRQNYLIMLNEILGRKLNLDIINRICSFMPMSDMNVFIMRRSIISDLLANLFNLM